MDSMYGWRRHFRSSVSPKHITGCLCVYFCSMHLSAWVMFPMFMRRKKTKNMFCIISLQWVWVHNPLSAPCEQLKNGYHHGDNSFQPCFPTQIYCFLVWERYTWKGSQERFMVLLQLVPQRVSLMAPSSLPHTSLRCPACPSLTKRRVVCFPGTSKMLFSAHEITKSKRPST